MNDRFKFRAWYQIKDYVYGYAYFDLLSNPCWNGEYSSEYAKKKHGVDSAGYYFSEINPKMEDDVIIEQCTGAIDNNNKLSFEGDKCIKDGKEWIIEYQQSHCRFLLKRNDGESVVRTALTNFEIIGNKHEVK